jgi:hypothetical protein
MRQSRNRSSIRASKQPIRPQPRPQARSTPARDNHIQPQPPRRGPRHSPCRRQFPIGLTEHLPPRFRALALLGRRQAARTVQSTAIPASEKPAQEGSSKACTTVLHRRLVSPTVRISAQPASRQSSPQRAKRPEPLTGMTLPPRFRPMPTGEKPRTVQMTPAGSKFRLRQRSRQSFEMKWPWQLILVAPEQSAGGVQE